MRDSKILHCAIKIPCWYDDNFYYVLELCGDGPDANGHYTGGFGFTRDGVSMACYYVRYDLYLVCKDKTKITKLPSAGVYNTAREPNVSLSYTDAKETANVYFYGISNNPDDEVKELPYVKDGVLIDRIRVRTGVDSTASNGCFWHEFSAKQEHKITIEGNISNYKIVKTDIHLSINGVSNGDFSREEKETLSDGTAKVIARLICDSGNEHESQHILTGYDSIKSLTYTDERYVPDQGWIGQFVARTLEGDFQKQIKDFNIENKNIELQLGVFGIDDSYNINAKTNVIKTWHSFGNFMITKPQDDNVSDNLKFTSMDYTKFFNQEFNGDFTNFRFPESLNTKVIRKETYTPFWLAQYVCEQVGVELGNTEETFVNASFELHNNPFQNKETCRDVMKEIAKLSLSWVRIDWDNKCYVEQLPQFDEYVSYENYNVLVPDFYFTLETQNKKLK